MGYLNLILNFLFVFCCLGYGIIADDAKPTTQMSTMSIQGSLIRCARQCSGIPGCAVIMYGDLSSPNYDCGYGTNADDYSKSDDAKLKNILALQMDNSTVREFVPKCTSYVEVTSDSRRMEIPSGVTSCMVLVGAGSADKLLKIRIETKCQGCRESGDDTVTIYNVREKVDSIATQDQSEGTAVCQKATLTSVTSTFIAANESYALIYVTRKKITSNFSVTVRIYQETWDSPYSCPKCTKIDTPLPNACDSKNPVHELIRSFLKFHDLSSFNTTTPSTQQHLTLDIDNNNNNNNNNNNHTNSSITLAPTKQQITSESIIGNLTTVVITSNNTTSPPTQPTTTTSSNSTAKENDGNKDGSSDNDKTAKNNTTNKDNISQTTTTTAESTTTPTTTNDNQTNFNQNSEMTSSPPTLTPTTPKKNNDKDDKKDNDKDDKNDNDSNKSDKDNNSNQGNNNNNQQSAANSGGDGGSSNAGVIGGAVGGAVAAVVLAAVVGGLLYRRHRQNKVAPRETEIKMEEEDRPGSVSPCQHNSKALLIKEDVAPISTTMPSTP